MTYANLSTSTIQGVLDWLAAEHSLSPRRYRFEELLARVITVQKAGLSTEQTYEILELLNIEAYKIIQELFSNLSEAVLPVPKHRRKLVRAAQDYLEALATAFSILLSDLKDHNHQGNALLIIVNAYSSHLLLSFSSTFPAYVSIWRKLHQIYALAVDMELDLFRQNRFQPTVRDRYLHVLLLSCLQPAAFTSTELFFLNEYIAQQENLVDLFEAPPENAQAIFWIPVNEDFPAHAVSRRQPEASESRYFFACDPIAGKARSHIKNIENGVSARSLNIPVFAMTPAGRGVLRRIADLWSRPVRRRFQRRMDSTRVLLRISLGGLWWSINFPEADKRTPSQWMVINNSPDGYSVMHVSGKTRSLYIGDIVALQEESNPNKRQWQLCMVRWALSENPEHLELGLQVISPTAIPAEIIVPRLESRQRSRGRFRALILPELPPLRPNRTVVMEAGKVNLNEKVFLVSSADRTIIQEVVTTLMYEQTARIEMYEIMTLDSDE